MRGELLTLLTSKSLTIGRSVGHCFGRKTLHWATQKHAVAMAKGTMSHRSELMAMECTLCRRRYLAKGVDRAACKKRLKSFSMRSGWMGNIGMKRLY